MKSFSYRREFWNQVKKKKKKKKEKETYGPYGCKERKEKE